VNQVHSKIYVLDTSVLIDDPDVLYKLGVGEIVIPTAVIKEIDGLKRHPDPEEPRAKAARKVARTLDMLGSYQDISVGARTSGGSTVRIVNKYERLDDLASNADNRIVGTAVRLKEETQRTVVLVTTDGNMRTVTRSYGIRAENYPFYLDDSLSRSKKKILDRASANEYAEPFFGNEIGRNRKSPAFWPVALALAILLIILIAAAR
jgi:predicted ribonuclease YlaK